MPHRERPRDSVAADLRQGRTPSEPPRTYTTEVRRASLLPDEVGQEFDPRAHFNLMMGAAPPPADLRRSTLNPGITERRSGEPGRPPPRSSLPESSPAAPRKTLGPLATLRSMLPGGTKPPAHEEDPRFAKAQTLRQQNRKLEAVITLEELRRFNPDYPQVRELLFEIAVELGAEDRLKAHIDWGLQQHSQQQDHEKVCGIYRKLRNSCPNFGYAEKSLIAVLIASEKEEDARVTLDVTKLLLREFPKSPALPRAVMASALAQIAEGRSDLARATLESLIARFPFDSLAGIARQKLNDVW